jgi:hypothetical protein
VFKAHRESVQCSVFSIQCSIILTQRTKRAIFTEHYQLIYR